MAIQTRDILTQIFFFIGLFALTSIIASGSSEGLTAHVNNIPTHSRGLALVAKPLSLGLN